MGISWTEQWLKGKSFIGLKPGALIHNALR